MYRLRKLGKKERRLLGVVGGISRYVDPTVDPVIWRIIFVVLTAFNPIAMVLLYFIGALVLKPEGYEILNKYPITEEELNQESIKEMADRQREEDKKEEYLKEEVKNKKDL